MGELTNCPNCDSLFLRNKFQDVCQACYKEEEKIFEMVYQYIRKKENRTATIAQVVEDTGVDEDLLMKFIRTGKLKLAQFPNLGYKCEKCGQLIREGKLCMGCTNQLRKQLDDFQQEQQQRLEIEERNRRMTYYIDGWKKSD